MASTRAAIRYAKAILDLANSKGVAEAVNNDMKSIASAIETNTELSTFIQNPTTTVEVKESALLEVFADVNGVTKGLFHLLFENKRFEILDAIAVEYNKLFDESNGVEVAKVTTAIPMDAALEAKVLAKVATLSDKKITIENVVDPSIIGGFILRIGDNQYNASVANRLQVLKRELSN
ncbi:ATP synthase F1 subunit delta [Flavobacterium johnsoniae]|uniref:ATP synthase subunit delta n=1 Tax=Flavobacterium johnsoniae (strain ATCC 17061 / DSM 2064 / JCM 8514 / BCRC 14874 / CCUG 350202 / NBRC 14942 / NCIMB 11054 / UW101) TaxID=376686 RepID=ATPD_FLAJ1|nr:ATP synthase F1 subunit delta [Flavobacterium johnsoniae]A5FL33.1 RecName: Full=ATP synthase subunit delta; AltName: Full=ATP synthase F(1) sector subunit delta; AltName: Full=F-type ATPase subunit delta; Short=F-ATPase subunit delta [Flavobacterium johnsoniae UW101]ABQ04091.1 ATP synthase F1, delta subunit [Flavobacterium johnsoniae UW101]OXG02674.1 ATP synthase F1 subunit delta [Flavobacterium johnsoniae UW101]WQG79038.1 ATP synthase F1 subunit delta [Flavobacterium johnsoniae UW101]SHK12